MVANFRASARGLGNAPAGPPLTVAVLAGGESAEREVSLRSGAAVCAALDAAGHRTVAIDPAGRELADVDWTAVDACFIALHGGAGEDGRVQQQLEHLGVPYTGSGPEACRLAMSKSAAKQRFAACRVPTPRWALLDVRDVNLAERASALDFPLVIKPDAEGSSLGVATADNPADLAAAVATAGEFGNTLVAELLIHGREFTVAVVGERALPIVEIVTPERVFSYEAKYASSLTEYRFDFELSTRVRAELLHAAVAATRALGTRGLVRVDMMVGHDSHVWVLEVNTVPGLTPRSLAPLAAERAGWPMSALCDELIRQCTNPVGVA